MTEIGERVIQKYSTTLGSFSVLPVGKVLLVSPQNYSPFPFVRLECSVPLTPMPCPRPSQKYVLIGTGDAPPNGFERAGSCICGDYVWHVYREMVIQ
jgi:hypothetical protein